MRLILAVMFLATLCSAQSLVPGGLGKTTDMPWLQFNCHKWAKEQFFNPHWTVIITSKKPGIKQLRSDRWEISFTD